VRHLRPHACSEQRRATAPSNPLSSAALPVLLPSACRATPCLCLHTLSACRAPPNAAALQARRMGAEWRGTDRAHARGRKGSARRRPTPGPAHLLDGTITAGLARVASACSGAGRWWSHSRRTSTSMRARRVRGTHLHYVLCPAVLVAWSRVAQACEARSARPVSEINGANRAAQGW